MTSITDEREAPSGRRRLKWILGSALVLGLLVLVALRVIPLPGPVATVLGLGPRSERPAAPPRLVRVAAVQTSAMPVLITSVGSIDPLRTVSIKSRVDGQVVQVGFRPGDAVKTGEVLFVLDKRPLQSALLQTQAALARDEAQQEYNRINLERQTQLLANRVTTQDAFDTARTTVAVTERLIAADKAAVENARLSLDYATIISPINGRTGKILIDLGNMIKANDTVSMVTINQVQPIYATFAVPQKFLPEIRAHFPRDHLKVNVARPDSADVIATGDLDFVDNSIDPSTGTITLRGVFKNETEALWPGQFVNATLVLRTDLAALVVPAETVQTGRNGTYVFVVKPDNTVSFRAVRVDRVVGNSAVIAEGLAAQETVVVDGQLNLIEGSRIQVAQDTAGPGMGPGPASGMGQGSAPGAGPGTGPNSGSGSGPSAGPSSGTAPAPGGKS